MKTSGQQPAINRSIQMPDSAFVIAGSTYDLQNVNLAGSAPLTNVTGATANAELSAATAAFIAGNVPSVPSGFHAQSNTSLTDTVALPLNQDGSVHLAYVPDMSNQFSATLTGGNTVYTTLHDVSGTATLTYTYLIPEPGTYAALLGLAVAGAAMVRRRRIV